MDPGYLLLFLVNILAGIVLWEIRELRADLKSHVQNYTLHTPPAL